MAIDRGALKGAYARLKGLDLAMPQAPAYTIRSEFGKDIDDIVGDLSEILEVSTDHFKIPYSAYESGGKVVRDIARMKLLQVISYLEHVHHVGREIVEIGTLYNSIHDEELRNRVADLLSAPGHFDRLINQATQVLEDRIRQKFQNQESLTGAPLVNAVLKRNVDETVLKVSDDEGEHGGFCDIIRGMVGAFRNPTHHQISERFS